MVQSYDQLTLLSNLIDDALIQGADAADAVVFDASSVSVSCRLGDLEKLERSESKDLGLRVFVGKQQAIVSSTDFEEKERGLPSSNIYHQNLYENNSQLKNLLKRQSRSYQLK